MTTENSLARLTKFLLERSKMPRIDQTEIHSLNIGTEREAVLLVSDLESMLSSHVEMVGLLRDISGTLQAADPMKERILETLVKVTT